MFINADIETILEKLSKLEESTKPNWGSMSAQRMVEHLTDVVRNSNGKIELDLLVPEEKLEKMQLILESDSPMPKNFEAPFVLKDTPLRHAEIELAIDELTEEWCDFEEYFENDDSKKALHPYYGNLNFEQWKRLHSKHFTHHFEQFGLI
jgi:hypothetical protein